MRRTGPFFEDVAVGLQLPELRRRPDTVQLFRFSAVTWNAHRIHFERDYAKREGYDDVLVHSQLHGAMIAQAVTDWMGPRGRLATFSWQNRAPATGGTELVIHGVVRRVFACRGEGRVEIDLEERDGRGSTCVVASATVVLPRRGVQGEVPDAAATPNSAGVPEAAGAPNPAPAPRAAATPDAVQTTETDGSRR